MPAGLAQNPNPVGLGLLVNLVIAHARARARPRPTFAATEGIANKSFFEEIRLTYMAAKHVCSGAKWPEESV
jgi:hypothetical protein